MSSSLHTPAIRVIKLILDILWYGAIVVIVIGIPLWFAISSEFGGMVCAANVNYRPGVGELLIKLLESDSSLVVTNHHTSKPEGEISGFVVMRSPNAVCTSMFLFSLLFEIGWSLAILLQLRKLFGALKQGTSFTLENVRRLRTIGWILFLGTLLDALTELAVMYYLNSQVIVTGASIRLGFYPDYTMLFVALMLIAIAEWFRHGVELEEDKVLTI